MPFDEQEIFERALVIKNEAERQAYLKSACGEDADLIGQIEGLLNSAQDAGSFMSKRAVDSMDLTADVENLSAEGMTIGSQLTVQLIGVAATIAWCGAATFIILKVVGLITPLRIGEEKETEGLDLTEHDERGYIL